VDKISYTARPAVARLLRNDRRVMTAATRVLSERGWGGFSVRAVAQEANLADPTVKQRHADPLAMAVAVWRSGLGDDLIERFRRLLWAHGLLESSDGDDPEARSAAWHDLIHPTDTLRAGLELITIAAFEPSLGAAIDHDFGAALRGWCSAAARSAARLTAARRALLLIRAFGESLTERWQFVTDDTLATERADVLTALRRSVPPKRMPQASLTPFLSEHLDPDDPKHDALLRTLLHQIADRGFEGALMNAVYNAANVTKSFAFSRYPSKLAMFLAAVERHRRITVAANFALQTRLNARYDDTTTLTVFLRTGMQPAYALGRALASEQVRMSWHEPAVRASYLDPYDERVAALTVHIPPDIARSHVHRLMMLTEGCSALARFVPDAWRLPLYQVFKPYLDVAIERVPGGEA
jgi:AcrR family transcriptional regulator